LKKNNFKILTPILLYLFVISSFAQDKNSHELGFIFGSASFTTDYGERYNFQANVGGNVGPGFGLIYYINFTDYRYRWNQRTNYFSEHFRVRGEFSYMAADLEHFGQWAEENSIWGEQLRAMHGRTQVFNLGAQMEFHIVDIVDFGSRRIPRLKFSPYLSLGMMVDFYNPSLESDLGDWKQDPSVLYPKWAVPGTVDTSSGITGSITGGIGTRFKIGEYSDILLESRWQYFLSNWVDGLNAKDDPANKYNDWLLYIHVGYVYYLN
jgi:hypothetical protein